MPVYDAVGPAAAPVRRLGDCPSNCVLRKVRGIVGAIDADEQRKPVRHVRAQREVTEHEAEALDVVIEAIAVVSSRPTCRARRVVLTLRGLREDSLGEGARTVERACRLRFAEEPERRACRDAVVAPAPKLTKEDDVGNETAAGLERERDAKVLGGDHGRQWRRRVGALGHRHRHGLIEGVALAQEWDVAGRHSRDELAWRWCNARGRRAPTWRGRVLPDDGTTAREREVEEDKEDTGNERSCHNTKKE
jgi:hypothetical protein